MFDPENVERRLISGDYDEPWRPDMAESEGWGTAEHAYQHSYVSSADYDQLLELHNRVFALYRELRDGIDFLHETRTAQAAPPETRLPTIEEMCGILDLK